MAEKTGEKVDIENVNHPGKAQRVDAAMYQAMKRALLKVLPKAAPGLTVAEIGEAVASIFPRTSIPAAPRPAGG